MATVFKAKEGVLETREQTVYKPRLTCRACGDAGLQPILSLGEQYLVRFPKDIDLDLPRAPLNLVRCGFCGLLQLGETVDPDLLFKRFWYRTSINDSMRLAMKDIVRHGLEYHDGGSWLDIGANDGYLLSCVPGAFTKIACEPAQNLEDRLHDVADLVISDYFTPDKVDRQCQVITSVAMFYDLDNPGEFVAGVAKCLSEDGIWINQLNDSPTMLKANAFDSICHEHLCYYDVHTLKTLYAAHGLTLTEIRFNDVNGGSVRTIARKSGMSLGLLDVPKVRLEDCEAFAERTQRWKQMATDLIRGPLALGGPLWVLGASTKGAVLLQYLDCDDAFIGVADRNPDKAGCLMVGSWLPITDELTLRSEKPKYGLVLPWAFRNEIVAREAALRRSGTTLIFPLPSLEFVL